MLYQERGFNRDYRDPKQIIGRGNAAYNDYKI